MLLRISHVEDAHDPRFLVLAAGRSYVVSGGGHDIVLADSTVSTPHAQLTLGADGEITVEDLGSATGTFVDDEPLVGPARVEPGQWIRVGETILQVTFGEQQPVANLYESRPETPAEQAFLAALREDPADDVTRAVYADWLEAEGFRIGARYVRLELAGDVDCDTSEIVGNACLITEAGWRAVVSRGPIGACDHPRCPGRWHALARDARPFVRTCATCQHDVHYCASRADVAAAGQTRQRVVFDAGLPRSSNAHVYAHGEYERPDDRCSWDYATGLAELFHRPGGSGDRAGPRRRDRTTQRVTLPVPTRVAPLAAPLVPALTGVDDDDDETLDRDTLDPDTLDPDTIDE